MHGFDTKPPEITCRRFINLTRHRDCPKWKSAQTSLPARSTAVAYRRITDLAPQCALQRSRSPPPHHPQMMHRSPHSATRLNQRRHGPPQSRGPCAVACLLLHQHCTLVGMDVMRESVTSLRDGDGAGSKGRPARSFVLQIINFALQAWLRLGCV